MRVEWLHVMGWLASPSPPVLHMSHSTGPVRGLAVWEEELFQVIPECYSTVGIASTSLFLV